MRDKFESSEPIGLMKGCNEIYRKGYKSACVEVYKKLLEHGYSEEDAKELAGIEEEDVEKYSKK